MKENGLLEIIAAHRAMEDLDKISSTIVMICGALIVPFIDLLHQISARERWQG